MDSYSRAIAESQARDPLKGKQLVSLSSDLLEIERTDDNRMTGSELRKSAKEERIKIRQQKRDNGGKSKRRRGGNSKTTKDEREIKKTENRFVVGKGYLGPSTESLIDRVEAAVPYLFPKLFRFP